MSRWKLIIAVTVGGIILLAGIVATVFGGKSGQPVTAPEIIPSASASPIVEAGHSHDQFGKEAQVGKQQELGAQPLIKRLPYDTRYWSLVYDGVEQGKYKITGNVYYTPGVEDPAPIIAKQRPFIERYVRGSGQPADSYTLDIKAVGRD